MQLSIKEWRRAKGISQKEMAKLIDVNINTYIAWEENPGNIRLNKAVLIAEKLGISLEDILFTH